jgi:hypothetical protein
MLRKLRSRLTYANVVATLALFVALGGTAYAVNTVGSSDIIDGQVKSVDIGNGEVNSADVKDQSLTTFDVSTFLGADIVDGSLEDQDIAEGTFVNFLASINSVGAHNCGYNTVAGVNAAGDHLVLTPSFDDSPGIINYTAEYAADGTVKIKACNPTDFAYGAHTTRFNLLVIDAH